jgi:hypothetical protein
MRFLRAHTEIYSQMASGRPLISNPAFMQLVRKKWLSPMQLPVILRIFEENQNAVDMHTSVMCINILQHIKAVAPKL